MLVSEASFEYDSRCVHACGKRREPLGLLSQRPGPRSGLPARMQTFEAICEATNPARTRQLNKDAFFLLLRARLGKHTTHTSRY